MRTWPAVCCCAAAVWCCCEVCGGQVLECRPCRCEAMTKNVLIPLLLLLLLLRVRCCCAMLRVCAALLCALRCADLVLSPHVPDGEADVFVLHRLHVEADGGDGGDHLAQLELIQDGGLPRGVQAHHQNAHLLLAKHAREQLAERKTHSEDWRRGRREREVKEEGRTRLCSAEAAASTEAGGCAEERWRRCGSGEVSSAHLPYLAVVRLLLADEEEEDELAMAAASIHQSSSSWSAQSEYSECQL